MEANRNMLSAAYLALCFVMSVLGVFIIATAQRGVEATSKMFLPILVSTGPVVAAVAPIPALQKLFVSFMTRSLRKAVVIGTAMIVLVAFALSYIAVVTVPIVKYAAEMSAIRGTLSINATAIVVPVQGGYNITYTIVVDNRNPYPVKITAVQTVLGILALEYLSRPNVTVEPNGRSVLVIHTFDRYPIDSGYHRIVIYVVRADARPLNILGLAIEPPEAAIEVPIEVQMYVRA